MQTIHNGRCVLDGCGPERAPVGQPVRVVGNAAWHPLASAARSLPPGNLVRIATPSGALGDTSGGLGVVARESVQRPHYRVQVTAPRRAIGHREGPVADGESARQRGQVRYLRGQVPANAGVTGLEGASGHLLPAVHLSVVDGGLLRAYGVRHIGHDVRQNSRDDSGLVGESDRGWHAAVRAPAPVAVAPVTQEVVEGVVFQVEHNDVADWPRLSGRRADHGGPAEPSYCCGQERDHACAQARPYTVSCH
jgi:hypothetical protein